MNASESIFTFLMHAQRVMWTWSGRGMTQCSLMQCSAWSLRAGFEFSLLFFRLSVLVTDSVVILRWGVKTRNIVVGPSLGSRPSSLEEFESPLSCCNGHRFNAPYFSVVSHSQGKEKENGDKTSWTHCAFMLLLCQCQGDVSAYCPLVGSRSVSQINKTLVGVGGVSIYLYDI